jgi:hypothetical protein
MEDFAQHGKQGLDGCPQILFLLTEYHPLFFLIPQDKREKQKVRGITIALAPIVAESPAKALCIGFVPDLERLAGYAEVTKNE